MKRKERRSMQNLIIGLIGFSFLPVAVYAATIGGGWIIVIWVAVVIILAAIYELFYSDSSGAA